MTRNQQSDDGSLTRQCIRSRSHSGMFHMTVYWIDDLTSIMIGSSFCYLSVRRTCTNHPCYSSYQKMPSTGFTVLKSVILKEKICMITHLKPTWRPTSSMLSEIFIWLDSPCSFHCKLSNHAVSNFHILTWLRYIVSCNAQVHWFSKWCKEKKSSNASRVRYYYYYTLDPYKMTLTSDNSRPIPLQRSNKRSLKRKLDTRNRWMCYQPS